MNYFNKRYNHFINCTSMLLIILFLSSNMNQVPIAHAADAQWKTESFTLPVNLRGAAVHYKDGKMYVIGGESKHLSVLDTVYIYDFETNEWSTGASMTNKRFLFASNLVDGKIYVMGGYNNTTTEWYAVNNVDVYDIETNTWTQAALCQHLPHILNR